MAIGALDWFIDPGLVSAPAVSMFPVNFDLELHKSRIIWFVYLYKFSAT